ncbi:cytochrome c biogenesis protein CcsA [Bacteroides reticulotermitis]|uniref:Cytochrome C-type biogenesis protein n=2 Tax=Bacteroides reticulotermitis TaxID=1133319 RepID=W4UXS3_9BACE|nr:cytochrome c biogenesis protein CcsA [Bacteroides reticulotermitis]MBB4045461.1 cytochrome c-type biogenesis protein CcsB [Bacteroides reticulotermitis]GAE86020.1 cytochrome C-type biogenesis protein [Bacteroides reticulotermitis JCM 10512]
MKKLLIVLYICLVGLLAATTFVEQAYGTDFVEKHIYHTYWFCGLWGAIAAITVVALIQRGVWRRLPIVLLHGSFLVILVGAMITFIGSEKGQMHLRPGVAVGNFHNPDNGKSIQLPFTIQLDSFRIAYYPGTEAPADYISYISYSLPDSFTGQGQPTILHEQVSMNRIFTLHGFRFYQSSFDDDGQGSWLTVNYDPWGTGVTYAGYILLGISMLWTLFARSGEFRRLLSHPLLKKGGVFVLLLGCLAGTMQAQKRSLPALNRVQADSLAQEQVIYQDRVVPFNTLARDFVQKLSGKASYQGLTAEQVIGGWLLYPEVWRKEPLIYIKNAELRHLLGLKTSYASLTDLFDGPVYRLQAHWQREQGQSKLAKAIQETDEKVGLILMLEKGTFIHPLPTDGSVKPLSATHVKAELLYNHIPFSKILFMVNLTVGLLAFLLLLHNSLRRTSPSPKAQRISRVAKTACSITLYAVFLFHLAGYCLRWYIGGRVPLSNGYETMQFMALCILLLACLLHRRFPFTVPFGFLLSGFALLVSYLGQMNPQITPLMPVLVSPWLSIHVSLIMMSYALLAFMMLNGILALCLRKKGTQNQTADDDEIADERVEQLTILSRLLLYPATFFLGAGIFLGAVWANVSWGRYWAWDPKEVWALITFLVYGVAFHSQNLRIFRNPLFFHIYMIIAFLTVLMTYFGVNYILGGMHSYANA